LYRQSLQGVDWDDINKKFWEELIAYRIENEAFNNSSILASEFVAAVTFLPSRCLATIGGFTYRHIDW
jgi:hypothetical protein